MTHFAVVLSLTGACNKKDSLPSESDSPLGTLLQNTKSPLEASTAVREAIFKSCQDMLAVLKSLDLRSESDQFSVRTTIGLIEETLSASRSACSKKDQESALGKIKTGNAASIALSLIAADPQVALTRLSAAKPSAIVLRRRAQLHFELKAHAPGLDALVASLAYEDDEATRVRAARLLTLAGDAQTALQLCEGRNTEAFRLPRAGAFAALGRYQDSISQIDEAELHLRQELADEAVRFAANPQALANEKLAGAEVLLAVRNRIGKTLIDKGAALLQRAVQLNPSDGELWTLLAETLEATVRPLESVKAWDEAAKRSPGAERPILAPIRILKEEGQSKEAKQRAAKLAALAGAAKSSQSEALRLASLAYRYAGDSKKALALAQQALESRPGDGRLTAELASRLEEDTQFEKAAQLLATLLVCGARGQAWHRHEIAARLTLLIGSDALTEYLKEVAETCSVVDAEDLWSQVESVP